MSKGEVCVRRSRRDVRGSCRNKVGRCFTRMERGGGTENEEGEGGSR